MDPISANLKAWNNRTSVHVESEMYDVPGFIAGKSSLKEIELELLPEVEGKRLLHLQCHFGLDTLSWARKGAIATGVDFSPVAIEKAEELNEKAGLDAKFVCSELYAFGESVRPVYDVVFVSYGALNWLSDVSKWAKVVANSLRPGGKLVLVEFHPVYGLIDGESYFHVSEPFVSEEGTYTENCSGEISTMATWSHSLSDILNGMIDAGLKIDALNEYPFSPYNCFEGLEEREPGRFSLLRNGQEVPLVFSVQARKS